MVGLFISFRVLYELKFPFIFPNFATCLSPLSSLFSFNAFKYLYLAGDNLSLERDLFESMLLLKVIGSLGDLPVCFPLLWDASCLALSWFLPYLLIGWFPLDHPAMSGSRFLFIGLGISITLSKMSNLSSWWGLTNYGKCDSVLAFVICLVYSSYSISGVLLGIDTACER